MRVCERERERAAVQVGEGRAVSVQGHDITLFGACKIVAVFTGSNGNDIETKRNDASIIGVFSVPKRNERTYSKTL